VPPSPSASPAAGILTLGVLELSSVARGLVVCDAALKKAHVRILRASPVGSGKFIVILTGAEADLQEAMEEGISIGDDLVVGQTYLPQVHPQVVGALARKGRLEITLDSVGILESRSLASLIRAADVSAKISQVQVVELTFDLDLGGKGYFTVTGELAEVMAAVEAAEAQLRSDGAFIAREIIARPHEGMTGIVLGR
jgi:microcompartment protein CcmL/EutN